MRRLGREVAENADGGMIIELSSYTLVLCFFLGALGLGKAGKVGGKERLNLKTTVQGLKSQAPQKQYPSLGGALAALNWQLAGSIISAHLNALSRGELVHTQITPDAPTVP